MSPHPTADHPTDSVLRPLNILVLLKQYYLLYQKLKTGVGVVVFFCQFYGPGFLSLSKG